MNKIVVLANLTSKIEYKQKINNYKRKWMLYMFDILVYLFAIALLTAVCYVLQVIIGYDDPLNGIMSFCIFLFEGALFIFALVTFIKVFGDASNIELTSSLPISHRQIFLSRFLVTLKKTYGMVACVVFPVLIAIGVISSAPISYYFLSIIISLILPILPMGVAMLIAIPCIMFKASLSELPLVYLIAFCTIVTACFVVYSDFIFILSDYLLFNKKSDLPWIILFLLDIASSSYVSDSLLMIVLGTNVAMGLLRSLAVSIAVLGIGLTVFVFLQDYLMNVTINSRHIVGKKPKKARSTSPFFALMQKEHKSIMRNSDYLTGVVGVAIVAPVFIFICNNFIVSVVTEQLGQGMAFATTVLVVLLFSAIICAPSASFISKDGMMFFYTKLFPISYTKVFISKGLTAVIWAVVSSIWSFAVVTIFDFVPVGESLGILFVNLLFCIGLIYCGVCINMSKPNLHTRTNQNNNNVVVLMMIGATVAIVSAMIIFIFSKEIGPWIQFAILSGIVTIFTIVNIVVFQCINKKCIENIGG